tara:strand:- start:522 stop:797 length:276 start_codon:yes stop_codon:yes gene_type:complete
MKSQVMELSLVTKVTPKKATLSRIDLEDGIYSKTVDGGIGNQTQTIHHLPVYSQALTTNIGNQNGITRVKIELLKDSPSGEFFYKYNRRTI